MAIPKNASLSSQLGQAIEELTALFGHSVQIPDLSADLWDSFCAQNCGISHVHKTPEQYADYTG